MEKEKIYAYALKNAIEHNSRPLISSVINSLFSEGLEKKDIKKIIPQVQLVIDEVSKLSLEIQKEKFEKLKSFIKHRKTREGLPNLPKAKIGKVITRMSPSPSAPLHIGHILAILPNFLYAQKYKGKFYIRIEDTNPDNIYPPAYKMIKNESKWLCKNKVKFIIQSERMNLYYKYAEKLIKKDSAYICICNPEEFKKLILKSKSCPCRNLSKNENLKRWKKMLDQTENGYEQGQAVLRFKSDLKDKNPAMRDFPLARINTTYHPLQKNKYRVWPLMNLAVAVDDIEQKITHVIRGKDHKDNAKRQKMIYKALNRYKNYPWIAFIGKLHLKGLALSSRKILESVKKGEYSSFEDPNLPSVASLKKRYPPEVFWKFAEQRGVSEVDKTISYKELIEILDTFNKNTA